MSDASEPGNGRLDAADSELRACLNSHGLYNSFQCVLRLSPEVHRHLANVRGGIHTFLGLAELRAYSTYLHETIHWWQHVGSTSGLILSLSYPAQTHANYAHLKTLLSAIGAKKSILKWITASARRGGPDS